MKHRRDPPGGKVKKKSPTLHVRLMWVGAVLGSLILAFQQIRWVEHSSEMADPNISHSEPLAEEKDDHKNSPDAQAGHLLALATTSNELDGHTWGEEHQKVDVELFHPGDNGMGCKLDSRSLDFVGNGMTGHAFAGELVCNGGKSSSIAISKKKVVIKLQTRPFNPADTRGFYYYTSYDQYQRSRFRQLHDAVILHNSTTSTQKDWVERNLLVPIGEVHMPCSVLYSHMNDLNRPDSKLAKSGSYKGMVNATTEYNINKSMKSDMLLGTLYPFTNGTRLELGTCRKSEGRGMWCDLDDERKRGIVRDVIQQWQYMYQHNVFQCELLEHIYYSKQDRQTSIIDFQSHKVLPKEFPKQLRDNWHRRQLWQVLNMVGNMCTTPPDAKGGLNLWKLPFRVEDLICGNRNTGKFADVTFIQQLVNATKTGEKWCQQISYNNNLHRPLPWNSSLTQSAINNTAQMFQDLVAWSS